MNIFRKLRVFFIVVYSLVFRKQLLKKYTSGIELPRDLKDMVVFQSLTSIGKSRHVDACVITVSKDEDPYLIHCQTTLESFIGQNITEVVLFRYENITDSVILFYYVPYSSLDIDLSVLLHILGGSMVASFVAVTVFTLLPAIASINSILIPFVIGWNGLLLVFGHYFSRIRCCEVKKTEQVNYQ